MLHNHKDIVVDGPYGKVSVEVCVFGRGGPLSGSLLMYRHKCRWITPFERRLRGWADPSMPQWLRIIYGGTLLAGMLYKENPFLKLIPKDDWVGSYFPLPIRQFPHL